MRRGLGGVVAVVGGDDLADQAVADDVLVGELAEGDVVHAVEDRLHLAQARLRAAGKVDLRDVTRHDHLGVETQAGQEHLHLLHRRVLGLVKDDERVVEAATPHVGQWRHLDGAGGEELGHRLGVDHVVQSVVQRPQVGVDLVVQRAGQEAEPLAGLDGRPGQDDPVDLLGLQRLDGLRHGEVGLAGAGRADAEHDGVGVDGVHVPLLVEGLGPDRPPPRRQDALGQHLGRVQFADLAGHADDALDGVLGEALAGADDGHHLGEHLGALGNAFRGAVQRDLVAADVHIGVQRALEDAEETVTRPDDVHHGDGRGDRHASGRGGTGLGRQGRASSVRAVREGRRACWPVYAAG